MIGDSHVLLFVLLLCCGMMVVAAQNGQATTITSISVSTAMAAVVVGSFAVYLARSRSAEKDGARETIISKTDRYEIITGDRQRLEDKIQKIRREGTKQLVVVSDFDMTLTTFFMPDGSRGMSTHGILERSGYFGEAFTTRAKQIFNKYYPIEVDPNIDIATKSAAMSEWWETTHADMVAEGLKKSDIKACVAQGHFQFRAGVEGLLRNLSDLEVPVLIFSAGIGDVVEEMLSQRLALHDANIVSNRMRFDGDGKLIGFQDKTIHIFNKGAVALKGTPNYEKVRGRRNVILLGDSPGDLRMADGLHDSQTVLRIGFLNDKLVERRDEYLSLFDLVLVGDGPMSPIHELLAPIFTV